jgi:hypothetical protein
MFNRRFCERGNQTSKDASRNGLMLPDCRSKLNELAVALLHEDFAGAEVIRRVRERKPEVYLASVVSLLPKQSQIEKPSPFVDLTDAELDELEEQIAGMRAKKVARPELVANNEAAAVQPSAVEENCQQPASLRASPFLIGINRR